MSSRSAKLVVAGLVLVLAAPGCTGGGGDRLPTSRPGDVAAGATGPTGFNAAVRGVLNPSTVTGGTLRLAAMSDCDSWDPTRTYFRWCWTMQRFYIRQLMALAPGPAGGVVPDLATAPGTPNADRTVWTYTIRSGLRFENGSRIRAADIKYGIERMWSEEMRGGPAMYFHCLLDRCNRYDQPSYRGPFVDPAGLDSIQAPNDTTIVFRLNRPYADFDYLMALPVTAPVPRAKDTGEDYFRHPVASGPFKFESFDSGRGLTLVRNPQWDVLTDPIRRPLVDRVELSFYNDERDIDRLIESGTVDLAPLDGRSDMLRRTIVTDERLKQFADDPFSGAVRYLVLRPSVEPLDSIHCRRAIFYALDKAALQYASGGELAGQPTGSMTPLGLPGADLRFDPYPVGPGWTGDLSRARSELAVCGHPHGFGIRADAVLTADQQRAFEEISRALARVGIEVTLVPSCTDGYYCVGGCSASSQQVADLRLGMAICGWQADIPTTASFWTGITNTGAAYPVNPSVPPIGGPDIVAAINRSLTVPAEERAQAGHEVDRLIMDRALLLPYLLDKVVYYRNPRLTNVRLDQYAQYDLVNLGVGGPD